MQPMGLLLLLFKGHKVQQFQNRGKYLFVHSYFTLQINHLEQTWANLPQLQHLIMNEPRNSRILQIHRCDGAAQVTRLN